MNYICHKSIWTQGSDGRVLPLSRFAHNGHLRRGGQLDGLQGHRHHWHQADYLQTQFKVLVSKSYLIFFSFYIFLQIFCICSVYFNRFFFIFSIFYIFSISLLQNPLAVTTKDLRALQTIRFVWSFLKLCKSFVNIQTIGFSTSIYFLKLHVFNIS